MSPRRILILSVALNFAALAALGYYLRRPAASGATTTPATVLSKVVTNQVIVTNTVIAPVEPAKARRVFHWSEVESPDYLEYIERLREIGVPEQTVRDIIIADVSKLFAEKRAALSEPERIFHFWESSERQYLRDNVKYQQAVRSLEKEKEQLIRDLLGVELRREISKIYGGETPYNRSLAFLPADRRQPIQDVLDRYEILEREIIAAANGKLDDAQRNQIEELHARRDSEITSMLSPAEQEEYAMTTSRLAQQIRSDLNGFDASREEFVAIHDIKKALNEETKRDGKETPQQREMRKELERQADEALQIALGPERYAEYKRSQDNAYEDLYELTKRYDLSKEAAASVYDMKRLAEQQTLAIEQNSSLSAEQKLEARKQIAQQIKTAAAGVLGDDAANFYFRRDGRWVDRISKPTPQKITASGQELILQDGAIRVITR